MANPYKTSHPKISRVMTHKARILIYLRARQPKWISSVEIEHQAVEWGAKGQTIDRRCRELENDGRVEKKMIDGIVWYRLTQAEPYVPAKSSYLDKLKLEDERERQVSFI